MKKQLIISTPQDMVFVTLGKTAKPSFRADEERTNATRAVWDALARSFAVVVDNTPLFTTGKDFYIAQQRVADWLKDAGSRKLQLYVLKR